METDTGLEDLGICFLQGDIFFLLSGISFLFCRSGNCCTGISFFKKGTGRTKRGTGHIKTGMGLQKEDPCRSRTDPSFRFRTATKLKRGMFLLKNTATEEKSKARILQTGAFV